MNIWFKPILLSSYIVVTTENMYNNSKLKLIGKQAFAYTNFFPYKSVIQRNPVYNIHSISINSINIYVNQLVTDTYYACFLSTSPVSCTTLSPIATIPIPADCRNRFKHYSPFINTRIIKVQQAL